METAGKEGDEEDEEKEDGGVLGDLRGVGRSWRHQMRQE